MAAMRHMVANVTDSRLE